MTAMYATSTWYCAGLRRIAALLSLAADRLDAARAAAGSVPRREPQDYLIDARDRILSRYY
jgi:hypothetical protein